MNPHHIKNNLQDSHQDNHSDESAESRIHLPMPDAENITVLTRELPNEPILPWHRFDSPWLHQETQDMEDDESQLNSGSVTPDESSAENEHDGEAEAEDESNENDGDQSPFLDLDEDQKPEFLNYDRSR